MIYKISKYTYNDKLKGKKPMLYSYIFECIKQRGLLLIFILKQLTLF